jgi:hypothetical protein
MTLVPCVGTTHNTLQLTTDYCLNNFDFTDAVALFDYLDLG